MTALACIVLTSGQGTDPAGTGSPPNSNGPSMRERAERIASAQRVRTSSADEERIVALFEQTKGLALTELKERVDAGDDHRDLQQLVYHDIDDASRRQRLLTHLRNEALEVRASHGSQGVKVLSDIDDTLYPSFADRREWSLGDAPYPGILEFYEALSGPAPPGRARLTLVSARPEERLGLLERQSSSKLRTLGLPAHTILSGRAWTLLSIVPGSVGERAVAEIGAEKLRDFRQWSELMAEFDFVISGDRTQADHVSAAEALALEDGRVLAAFIHDVGEAPRRLSPGLFYNETVLGHALDAFEGGWIDRDALLRVRDAVASGRDLGVYPPELEASVARDLAKVDAVAAPGR